MKNEVYQELSPEPPLGLLEPVVLGEAPERSPDPSPDRLAGAPGPELGRVRATHPDRKAKLERSQQLGHAG